MRESETPRDGVRAAAWPVVRSRGADRLVRRARLIPTPLARRTPVVSVGGRPVVSVGGAPIVRLEERAMPVRERRGRFGQRNELRSDLHRRRRFDGDHACARGRGQLPAGGLFPDDEPRGCGGQPQQCSLDRGKPPDVDRHRKPDEPTGPSQPRGEVRFRLLPTGNVFYVVHGRPRPTVRARRGPMQSPLRRRPSAKPARARASGATSSGTEAPPFAGAAARCHKGESAFQWDRVAING